MSSTEYELLPTDLKKRMIFNSEQNKNLKVGFYSKIYTVEHNGKNYKYRFHCLSNNNKKNHLTIIFSGKKAPHNNKLLENDDILFYDSQLECSLKLLKDVFEQELVDMNLSTEQKSALAQGKEITLNVANKSSFNNHRGNVLTTSHHTKSFCADYGYFLGTNTLFLKENQVLKNTQHKILNK